MISVLVPTVDRPDFLKHAIDSVNHQSRSDLIGEVLVSNNGGIDVSSIPNSYKHLPITYVNQPRKLRFGDHYEWLVEKAKFPLIAMLADDDMWGRYHLEEAHRQLQSHPSAIAVFNQTVVVRNSYRHVFSGYAKLAHSLQDDLKCQLPDNLIFLPGELMVDALIHTPLNIWSMIVRKTNVMNHFQIMKDPNAGVDWDRYFVWRLSLDGCIIAGREVGLFMRVHPQMGGVEMKIAGQEKPFDKSKEYSSRIIEESRALGLPVDELWDSFWNGLSPEDHAAVRQQGSSEFIAIASELLGSEAASSRVAPVTFAQPSKGQRLKNACSKVAQDCLPPFFYRRLAKLKATVTQ